LRIGQVLQPVQHRRAQQLEPRERKLRLGLHSRRADHAEPRRPLHRIVEECRLPGAGLTPYGQYLALTGSDPIEQLVESLAFGTPITEAWVSGHCATLQCQSQTQTEESYREFTTTCATTPAG
jgi:hypothetical protein